METITPPARDQRDLLRTIAEGTAGTVGAPFLRSLALPRRRVRGRRGLRRRAQRRPPPDERQDPRVLAGRRPAARGLRVQLADTPCERIADADVIGTRTRQRRALPARRLPRPPRARGLPRGAGARHLRRARRLRLRALPRPSRRGDEERAVLRIFAARAARSSSAAARRRSCTRARSRSPPRAPGAARRRRGAPPDRPRPPRRRPAAPGHARPVPRPRVRQAERDPRESGRLMGLAREQARTRARSCATSRAGCTPPG